MTAEQESKMEALNASMISDLQRLQTMKHRKMMEALAVMAPPRPLTRGWRLSLWFADLRWQIADALRFLADRVEG